jgi:hypothetical protein
LFGARPVRAGGWPERDPGDRSGRLGARQQRGERKEDGDRHRPYGDAQGADGEKDGSLLHDSVKRGGATTGARYPLSRPPATGGKCHACNARRSYEAASLTAIRGKTHIAVEVISSSTGAASQGQSTTLVFKFLNTGPTDRRQTVSKASG